MGPKKNHQIYKLMSFFSAKMAHLALLVYLEGNTKKLRIRHYEGRIKKCFKTLEKNIILNIKKLALFFLIHELILVENGSYRVSALNT